VYIFDFCDYQRLIFNCEPINTGILY
jgi:hypothetical protein